MKVLAPGANTTLPSAQVTWTMECDRPTAFGDYAAVALLATNDKRNPCGQPALFHISQDWMSWDGDSDQVKCKLDLEKLPAGADRVLAVVYVYSAAGPVSELRRLKLFVHDQFEFSLNLSENTESAIIVGEFYARNGEWKYRALSEGSAYGLKMFGRRINLDVDDSHPQRSRSSSPDSPRRNDAATGTAFAVGESHVMTCAHVIEDMSTIYIASFDGRYKAEPVVVDRRNDIALLRVEGARPLKPVNFLFGSSCDLGEDVVALGFPMAGLTGDGVQVTKGGVSALFGLRNDSSLMQFTAPIQPGSSGSPLFDNYGRVVAMVTSSVPDAQNMNFAVKSALLLSFLDASRVATPNQPATKVFTTSELTRHVQTSMWRVEASS